MTPDSLTAAMDDPEGIALVKGILERVGYRGHLGDFEQLVEDIAAASSGLMEALGMPFEAAAEMLASLTKSLEPSKPTVFRDKRKAALAAKKDSGKGPPSPSGWRGRERNTKYRSRS